MLYIKEFNDKKVIITDGIDEYTLTADGNQCFDRDILEDILDYEYRMYGRFKEDR